METINIPALFNGKYRSSSITNASRYFLADGIHLPDTISSRFKAQLVSWLCRFETQRFRLAALDAIEELSGVVQSGTAMYMVIYGAKRSYFAAQLIASDMLAQHVKIILTDRELTCGLLTIPRIFLYQVDTDRYPFTDRL